jgi:hypothetical protein
VSRLQPGASWLWGHQRTIFDKGVGLAYSEWFTELGSRVIKIKAAMFVRLLDKYNLDCCLMMRIRLQGKDIVSH